MLLYAQATSCDLLRVAPLEILSWSPGPGHHRIVDEGTVSILFSEEPDRASAESSFTLTEDGAALSGGFSWLGPALTFMPCGGLRANAEYRITVSADARNTSGVSLERSFEVTFSSKPEDTRPVFISSFPECGGILETRDDPVSVQFSEAIDAVSLRESISFSPAIKGVWNQESGGSVSVFTALEPWVWAEEYKASISADLLDTSGNRMGKPVSFCFTVGADSSPPFLLRAEAVDESGFAVAVVNADIPQDDMVIENPGWETSWKLRLHFSEPVSWSALAAKIAGEGGVFLEPDYTGDFTQAVDVRISGYPEWSESFIVRIPPGVEDQAGNDSLDESMFRFVFDGPGSRPPRFAGIRLPLAPGAALPEDRNLAVFSTADPYATLAIPVDETGYPVGVPVAASIEVYVELASGAAMNLLSLMKSFRFSSTNGAVEFSANRMMAEGLESTEPHAPWADYAVARIDGTLTNRVDSGIITIQLAAGFCDSRGNASNAAQRLALLK